MLSASAGSVHLACPLAEGVLPFACSHVEYVQQLDQASVLCVCLRPILGVFANKKKPVLV